MGRVAQGAQKDAYDRFMSGKLKICTTNCLGAISAVSSMSDVHMNLLKIEL